MPGDTDALARAGAAAYVRRSCARLVDLVAQRGGRTSASCPAAVLWPSMPSPSRPHSGWRWPKQRLHCTRPPPSQPRAQRPCRQRSAPWSHRAPLHLPCPTAPRRQPPGVTPTSPPLPASAPHAHTPQLPSPTPPPPSARPCTWRAARPVANWWQSRHSTWRHWAAPSRTSCAR
jgi:hypothetical protein